MSRATACAVLVMMLAACTNSPDGAFGVTWNTPADTAAAKLGVNCGHWETWPSYTRYVHCDDYSARTFWNHPVHLFRMAKDVDDGELAGIEIWFRNCDFAVLKNRLLREFRLEPGEYAEYIDEDFIDIFVGDLQLKGKRRECILTVREDAYDDARAEHDVEDWTWLYH